MFRLYSSSEIENSPIIILCLFLPPSFQSHFIIDRFRISSFRCPLLEHDAGMGTEEHRLLVFVAIPFDCPRYTKGVINEHKSKGEICVKVTQLCFRKQLKIMECHHWHCHLHHYHRNHHHQRFIPWFSSFVHSHAISSLSLQLRLNHCFIYFYSHPIVA